MSVAEERSPPLNSPRASEVLLDTQSPVTFDRAGLRQALRTRRRALSHAEQRRAALRAAERVARLHAFRRARRVAIYLANDGELDPTFIARQALRLGKECYLPVLHKRQPAMGFARWRPGDKLVPNRFGIPEPLPRAYHLDGDKLDLVCLPLVGFDSAGNRLGMGGGFYDRTFACRPHRPAAGPRLIGLAHQCQQVDALPVQPWDVPLDMVVTDRGLYRR